ncbi:MAG: hypothetical protein WDM87_15810 [Terracidiphilus sp.]
MNETYARFQSAAEKSGERFWRLPLGDEYAGLVKSDIADLKEHRGANWRSDYRRRVPEGVCG